MYLKKNPLGAVRRPQLVRSAWPQDHGHGYRESLLGQHHGLFLVADYSGLSVQHSQRQDADLIQYCYFSDLFSRKRGVFFPFIASPDWKAHNYAFIYFPECCGRPGPLPQGPKRSLRRGTIPCSGLRATTPRAGSGAGGSGALRAALRAAPARPRRLQLQAGSAALPEPSSPSSAPRPRR